MIKILWTPLPPGHLGKIQDPTLIEELRIRRRVNRRMVILNPHVRPPVVRVDNVVALRDELERVRLSELPVLD
jgi:hypothetical protein